MAFCIVLVVENFRFLGYGGAVADLNIMVVYCYGGLVEFGAVWLGQWCSLLGVGGGILNNCIRFPQMLHINQTQYNHLFKSSLY